MNTHTQMKEKFIFLSSYACNIAMWVINIGIMVKVVVTILTILTTTMAFFNQYKTFTKNFKTTWIVVFINRYVGRKPKVRHRKKSVSQPKTTNDE